MVTASGWAPPIPPRPVERAAEVATRQFGEGLVRALQDALRTDIDPASRRHLPVHRETAVFEIAEHIPRCPRGDEQRVRNQHTWSPRMRAEDRNGLAGLDEQGFVVLEPPQGLDDCVEG